MAEATFKFHRIIGMHCEKAFNHSRSLLKGLGWGRGKIKDGGESNRNLLENKIKPQQIPKVLTT